MSRCSSCEYFFRTFLAKRTVRSSVIAMMGESILDLRVRSFYENCSWAFFLLPIVRRGLHGTFNICHVIKRWDVRMCKCVSQATAPLYEIAFRCVKMRKSCRGNRGILFAFNFALVDCLTSLFNLRFTILFYIPPGKFQESGPISRWSGTNLDPD